MLNNLRGMAVFASVVDNGSFSGAGKELGITTSAVSQQIRSLENDLGIVLLHRSTRKLSLTEAGAEYYDSAKKVVNEAEKGRIRLTQLRDDLSGRLRVATTPELATNHLLPALSSWLATHSSIGLDLVADNQCIDMIDNRVDIAVRMSSRQHDDNALQSVKLANIRQVLVASPEYMQNHPAITSLKELTKHQLISISTIADANQLTLIDKQDDKKSKITMTSRFTTNSVMIATDLAKQSLGILRATELDVENSLKNGELVEILTDYQLPYFQLHALIINREQQPAKITGCIEVLKNYWSNI